jgi:hypothetical protein
MLCLKGALNLIRVLDQQTGDKTMNTQEKLNAFVKEHRRHMVAQAVKEFCESPVNQEPDIWVNYRVSHEAQCDINIYQPEDETRINIIAYALREFEDGTLQVNTEIGSLVADIVWKDCEDYLNFGG